MSSGDISGTKRGIIDPLVTKRPEKFRMRRRRKMVKIGQNGRNGLKSKHLKAYLGPALVPVLAQGGRSWHPVSPGFGSGEPPLAPR